MTKNPSQEQKSRFKTRPLSSKFNSFRLITTTAVCICVPYVIECPTNGSVNNLYDDYAEAITSFLGAHEHPVSRGFVSTAAARFLAMTDHLSYHFTLQYIPISKVDCTLRNPNQLFRVFHVKDTHYICKSR